MSVTILTNVKGKELPEAWLEKIDGKPDQVFKIIIDSGDVSSKGKIPQKGKWAKAAERLRGEGLLEGKSDEANKLMREFRDHFRFKDEISA